MRLTFGTCPLRENIIANHIYGTRRQTPDYAA
jgi:uncharacterized protein YlaN (UPF0358 family)